MGAYGAALYAKGEGQGRKSGILDARGLAFFTHTVKAVTCNGCENHCRLTVNTFANGARYIAGNRCDKPLAVKGAASASQSVRLQEGAAGLLRALQKGRRGTIGIPMGLNMFELYPFWYTFFKTLGFGVVHSPESDRSSILRGQHTIPPIRYAIRKIDARAYRSHAEGEAGRYFFYPCMSYNLDEHLGDNHYNCPVVAYYPEVLDANIAALAETKFIYDYVGLHRRKDFPRKIREILARFFDEIPEKEIKAASDAAYGNISRT